MASASSPSIHITCVDLNDEKSKKTNLSTQLPLQYLVKSVHKTVVAVNGGVNNYSPVKQSTSFTSLSSLAKPLNKGVLFANFSVEIYSDGDEPTMTPCLLLNSDATSKG